MIHIDTKYTATANPDPEIARREFRGLLKEAWRACGLYLFDQFVQKHFGREQKEYAFAPRAGEDASGKAFWRSYTGRKQKKFHHTLALVLTGRTREGAKRATIYPTSNGCRVALPGAVHLNQYKPQAKRVGSHAGDPPIDLREELLRVTAAEADKLAQVHGAAFVKAFAAARVNRQTRIA
jgi:hypothetical protein